VSHPSGSLSGRGSDELGSFVTMGTSLLRRSAARRDRCDATSARR